MTLAQHVSTTVPITKITVCVILTAMKSKNWSKGFSLLETLLYLAIFAIIGGSLFGILTNVVRISTREVSGDEVASQLQFAMETVTRLVQASSNIEIATTTATTTLKLRMADSTLDPTCISLVNGALKLSKGPDDIQPQNCSSATTDITTSKVVVDNALFKRVEFPGGHDQVAVDLQFSNTATGASKISRALRSGIARVSAATFDSDLLPNADNSYEVGFSGTKRWKNISISNLLNLGVISSDPSGIDGSIYYNSTDKTFRGKANGAWANLGGSQQVDLSTGYMNGFCVASPFVGVVKKVGSTYYSAVSGWTEWTEMSFSASFPCYGSMTTPVWHAEHYLSESAQVISCIVPDSNVFIVKESTIGSSCRGLISQ